VVATKTLTAAGGYVTSYALYDGLLRARQTQNADAAGGTGAVVTDTFYDTAGRAYKVHNPYTVAAAPSAELINSFDTATTIPAQTVTQFDGVGRTTASIFQVNAPPLSPCGTEKWRTTTSYGR